MLDRNDDGELREFFGRDKHLAPVGFVARICNVIRNHNSWAENREDEPIITTVNQLYRDERLTRRWWERCPNMGKKGVDHLYYLLRKYAPEFDAEIMAREMAPVYSVTEQPTPRLRWFRGVLEQAVIITSFDAAGKPIDQHIEWRDVPTEAA